MFDTMTITKAGGALCGAFLIYLLGSLVAEKIYHPASAHSEDQAKPYAIDTGSAEEDTATADAGGADEGSQFASLLAAGDADKGAKAFGKCKACHKLEAGAKGGGPALFAIVGRPIASVDGYKYSAALAGVGGEWTPEALNEWLEDPAAFAKGTKMTAKTKKAEDRINLITYLQTIGG